jgi:hypothetical protein
MHTCRHLALAATFLLPSSLLAQDKVENPTFANWAKFKKGTSVTMKSVNTVLGMTSESVITNTLIEVGSDKLVLEISSAVKANGMEFKSPPIKQELTKTIELPKGVKKEDFHAGKPPGTYEEGTETIKVGGTDVKTKWYKFKAEMDGTKTEAKTWISDDMPGMMVKTEMNITGKFASTMKMEVVEFKKP